MQYTAVHWKSGEIFHFGQIEITHDVTMTGQNGSTVGILSTTKESPPPTVLQAAYAGLLNKHFISPFEQLPASMKVQSYKVDI